MRISDWSSDVCSSDLAALFAKRLGVTTEWLLTGGAVPEHPVQGPEPEVPTWLPKPRTLMELLAAAMNVAPEDREKRSEEHTSELQSLMRISYAVFCLKKKKNKRIEEQNSKLMSQKRQLITNIL